MPIRTEAKRVKFGQALTDYDTQAQRAIAVLDGIKTNLVNQKAAMEADADFTAQDIAELDTTVANLATQIQALLA